MRRAEGGGQPLLAVADKKGQGPARCPPREVASLQSPGAKHAGCTVGSEE